MKKHDLLAWLKKAEFGEQIRQSDSLSKKLNFLLLKKVFYPS
jgi:hypothetical protein